MPGSASSGDKDGGGGSRGDDRPTNGKEVSGQEKTELKAQREKQARSIAHCTHVLTAYISQANGSTLWKQGDNKAVRQCIHKIASEPRKFPLVMGDILPDGSSFSGENSDDAMSTVPSLTPNYVSAIASGKDVSSIDLPILQPTEPPKMAFEGNSNGKQTNRSHFTHFWLCDGSGNQILGRAAMHLAHDGIWHGGRQKLS